MQTPNNEDEPIKDQAPHADDASDDLSVPISSAAVEASESGEAASDSLDHLADAADQQRLAHRPGDGMKQLPLDSDQRIDTDVLCLGCEYNLRGQLTTNQCPECGLAIAESLKSDHLRLADIAWLRAVKQGLLWLIIGTFTGIGLSIFSSAFEGIYASTQVSTSPFGPQQPASAAPVYFVNAVVTGISAAIMIFAYLQLTTPEPDAIRDRPSRGLTRWSAVPGQALSFLGAAMLIVETPAMEIVAGVTQVASAIALLIAFIASMLYLRSLAHRVPSQSLARQTSIVMWGIIGTTLAVIPLVLVAIFTLGNMFSPSGPAGPGPELILLLACPVGLSFIVFGIWWIVLMFVYHSKVAKVITRARRARRSQRIDADEARAAFE